MRYTPSLLDKLIDGSLSQRPGEVLRGLSLEELKDSVASDLESLLNSRSALAEEDLAPYRLCQSSVVNYGIIDFSALSLSSGLDRQQICRTIKAAIERHDHRLRMVEVDLDEQEAGVNRLNFTIRATLLVSEASEAVSFDARFEPTLQRYSIARQRPLRR